MNSLEANIPNEYPNIFMRRKKSRMNVQIYSLWKNPRIFRQMNIFVNKYSNIFEYPNICYTLVQFNLVKDSVAILPCFTMTVKGQLTFIGGCFLTNQAKYQENFSGSPIYIKVKLSHADGLSN